MPAGLIPNEGLEPSLLELLGAATPSILPWQMMFWKNDLVPDADTTLGDLEECDWAGYVRLTLTRAGWTVPTVSGGCAHSTWGVDPVEWTVSGGPEQTPFGCAYVDIGAGVLRFVQRFDDADLRVIIIPGVVKVLPEYTLTFAECA